MTRPDEDDRSAVDRAFAAMVAGYHLTADRPAPELDRPGLDRSGLDRSKSDRSESDGSESGRSGLDSDTAAGSAERPAADRDPQPAAETDGHWADNHPLFRFPVSPAPEPSREAADRPAPDAEVLEPYVPDPMPPLRRPGLPVLVGWIGIGWAVLVVLSAAFGVRLPGWVGWLAVLGFLGGFTVLISQLPRHRPPDAGDGAVL